MGELESKFPTEIWIYIVSQACLDKTTLASLSLVSSPLRNVAQRRLFRDITLHYQSSLAPYELRVNWKPYRDKIVGICSSSYLCSFIQQLRVVFCNTAPWEMPHSDLTDRLFCEMMDKVAFALPTMIILRRMSYFAPILLGHLHRAILLHPQLRRISITPSTCCKKPCAEASVHRDRHQSLQELEIAEWSPMQPIHGLTPPSIGARRCSLTSNILFTHSLSLRKLRVPVRLLYDAIAAVTTLPEFPHLQGLSIMRFCPLMPLEHLYDSMAAQVVRFLLRVHETIQQLDWRGYGPFNPFTELPPSFFPNLEALEGEGVELLLGNHSLRRLRLIASPGEVNEVKQEEENHSIRALRKCQMSSPQLTTLFIQQYILNLGHAPLISAFSALEELSCAFRIFIGSDPIPELVSLCLTPLEALINLVQRLLENCIPNLCHLHTLSIHAYNTGFKEYMPLESITKLASSLRSESLERFNFRLTVDEPDTSPLDKEVYETGELHRVRDAQGRRSQWISPLGKVITTDYIHCEVHGQCSMNRPLGHYEGWINI